MRCTASWTGPRGLFVDLKLDLGDAFLKIRFFSRSFVVESGGFFFPHFLFTLCLPFVCLFGEVWAHWLGHCERL